MVLAEVLTDGDASRLVERLVLRDRTVTSVGGYIGFMGEPFEVRDPTALLLQAHLPPGGDVDKVLRTVDEELDRLATDGLAAGELARTAGPDGHPPAARHRRGARPGAADGRAGAAARRRPS